MAEMKIHNEYNMIIDCYAAGGEITAYTNIEQMKRLAGRKARTEDLKVCGNYATEQQMP